ncbi:MAG: HAD-IA family hydrolase, partial [Pseudomonadota bacterium]
MFERFYTKYEVGAYRQRLNNLINGLPGPIGRDDNNIFSLQEVVGVADVDAVSFDFFDTLFFRTRLSLDQVFEKTAQLGSTLVPAPRDEALSRLYSARGFTSGKLKRAMQFHGQGDEPSLVDVFARSLRDLVPDDDERTAIARKITELEAAIELDNLVPNDQIWSVFRTLKELDRKVIITSDMYLHSDALLAILEPQGLMEYIDELLVSADFGITKNGGDLFNVVIERAGCAPERILHVGDNWTNDVERAREKGLLAYHYYNHERENDTRLLNGKANLAKPATVRRRHLSKDFGLGDPGPLRTLDRVIDQVIGPACALFLHDVLHNAERRGSSDLFFLTRDGTIFMEIANAMREAVPQLYPNRANHKILACSRATGALLGVRREDSDYLYINAEYLTEAKFSFEAFLDLYGIPRDEFAALPSITLEHIEALGDDMALEEFRDLYWGFPGLQDLLMDKIGHQKDLIVRYLEQIGLFDAHNPLLVDVGYSGTWGKQVAPVLEVREQLAQTVPCAEFEFFASNRFFTNNVRQMHPSLRMRPGRILNHQDRDLLTIALNYSWLEPFFLDPKLGKLDGFTEAETIEPVFKPTRFNMAERARIEGMRTALVGRC